MLTCLIPAWNEAPRIGVVLDAVAGHPMIDRVLVIDDGSSDGTGEIAREKGVDVLRTSGNLGKTAALVQGLRLVKGGHVLLLDADLLGLTAANISALIAPVLDGQAAAAISLRGNAPLAWRWIGLDYISGERVIPHSLLQPHLDHITALPRFGFEVYLNALLINNAQALAVVHWPNVSSPSKATKKGSLLKGIQADFRMIGDMFETIGILGCIRQIWHLHRRRV